MATGRRGGPERILSMEMGVPVFSSGTLPCIVNHPNQTFTGPDTIGRRFYVQYKRQLAIDSEVLCRTSAFPRKEPRVVSFTRFMVRVFRIPTATTPRGFNSLYSMLLYSYSCRPLEKGRGKAAGWMR